MTNNLDTLAAALRAATDDPLKQRRTWHRGGPPWDLVSPESWPPEQCSGLVNQPRERAKGVPSQVIDREVTEWTCVAARVGRRAHAERSHRRGVPESGSLIDEIVREGARRMIAAALEAEVNQYMLIGVMP